MCTFELMHDSMTNVVSMIVTKNCCRSVVISFLQAAATIRPMTASDHGAIEYQTDMA